MSVPSATPTPTPTKTILDLGDIYLTTGAVSLDPFTLTGLNKDGQPVQNGTPEKFKISSSTTTEFFIEAAYASRWAWRRRSHNYSATWFPFAEQFCALNEGKCPCKAPEHCKPKIADGDPRDHFPIQAGGIQCIPDDPACTEKFRQQLWDNEVYNNAWLPDDLSVRLGFVNASSDLSGATIIGSGDVYGQVSVGWNQLRYVLRSGTIPAAANDRPTSVAFDLPEITVAATSDRSFDALHWRVLAPAASISVGYPAPGLNDSQLVKVFVRGGFLAAIDRPKKDKQGFVEADANGLPEFESGTGAGLDFSLYVPIPVKVLPIINLGALVADASFNTGNPAQWSARAGYSLSWDALARAVGVGGSEGSK